MASKRPTIDKVRKLLRQHPEYLVKPNVEIDKLCSNSTMVFRCHTGHEFSQILVNALNHDGTLRCPICSNHRVLRGYNDMWTTAPEQAAYLANPEDGYCYTKNSNQKLIWQCPECQHVFKRRANQMSLCLYKCPACSDAISYPEKFMAAVLDQLYLPYERQKMFSWAHRKRYDFFVTEYNIIIEVNGKQHYEGIFERNEAQMLVDDEEKRNLALRNHIQEYIILDCRESSMRWMKMAIMNSLLPTILDFDKEDIDWDECHRCALNSITHDICDAYNTGLTVSQIAIQMDHSETTIRAHLKKGAILGLCSYDSQQALQKATQAAGQRVLDTMCKPVSQFDTNGNYIKSFPSIQEAQRATGCTHICDCLKGKRKIAGGYIWQYQ